MRVFPCKVTSGYDTDHVFQLLEQNLDDTIKRLLTEIPNLDWTPVV